MEPLATFQVPSIPVDVEPVVVAPVVPPDPPTVVVVASERLSGLGAFPSMKWM